MWCLNKTLPTPTWELSNAERNKMGDSLEVPQESKGVVHGVHLKFGKEEEYADAKFQVVKDPPHDLILGYEVAIKGTRCDAKEKS